MASKTSAKFETFLIIFFFTVSLVLLLFATGVFHLKVSEGPPLKYGFINTAGKAEIDLFYDSVGDFHNGLATVKKDGKVFVIDRNGNKTGVAPFHYQIDSLNIKHFIVLSPGEDSDSLRQHFSEIGKEQFGKKLFRILRDRKVNNKSKEVSYDFVYTYIDTQHKADHPPIYEEALPYHDSLSLVHAEYGKKWPHPSYFHNWAFIDLQGKYVTRPIYARAHSFSEGLAAVAIYMVPHGR
jgi:hypothetical protein